LLIHYVHTTEADMITQTSKSEILEKS